MSSATIAQTRNSFSSIVRSLELGELAEHYVTNRSRPVAKIVPVDNSNADISCRVGVRRGIWDDFDYDAFQALDDDVAELMGA